MSRYFSARNAAVLPYVPGEQPQGQQFIKLNTNESPYPPSPEVIDAIRQSAETLNLYNDPDFRALRRTAAEFYDVSPDCITFGNGSDEVLNLAFLAFADNDHPLRFPDLTYGFYRYAAAAASIPYEEINLGDDFRIDPPAFTGKPATIVIANPNAPTSLLLSVDEIERIVQANPDGVVIVDEAYIDFGGETAVPLTKKYENVLVVQTFSKSRSLAGARIGLAIGSAELIADINTMRNATVPYNVSTMAQKAAIAAYSHPDYYVDCCRKITKTRTTFTKALQALGFEVFPSMTNFVLVRSDKISGSALYVKLKENGILTRHFSSPRLDDYLRITIGSPEQMQKVVETITKILAG